MTLQGSEGDSPSNTCPFCQIIRGDAPATVVYRWDDCIAFTPRRPATLGHTLVVPVRHVISLWDPEISSAIKVAVRVRELAVAMKASLDLDGLNIIQSNGAAATQTVPHLHVHLVPRYPGDAMGAIWPEGSPVSADAALRAARTISSAVASLLSE